MWGVGRTRSLWSQFADDAAIVNDSHKETQLVLSFFQRWTTWADLTIRPDKSFAYGAAQRSGRYQQILPSFVVNGVPIPTIPIGEPMTYLGCSFTYASDTENAKSSLVETLTKVLTFVETLPISPLLKCHALNLQIRAHLSFALSHHTLPATWLRTCLDSMVNARVRHWLDLPPGATVRFAPLPHQLLGLDLVLPSLLAELCRFGTDITLAHSRDPAMRTLQELSRPKIPPPFHHLLTNMTRRKAVAEAQETQRKRVLLGLDNLQVQSRILKSLRDSLPQAEFSSWSGTSS